ncbi:MAG: hypothetical protein KA371_05690 [Acidobacteria bacterium]|jgi:hypothetical protein|nr:hypothetical protein [Acidobacteriota bacterium]
MSTIIKLLITALVLNACFQGGRSAWGFYEFEDQVQQAVLFSTTQTAEQLKNRIASIASEAQIELDSANFTVAYQGTQARITASYTDQVAVVPGGYKYKWLHALDLNMRRMAY